MSESKFTKGPWEIDPIEYTPDGEDNIFFGHPSVIGANGYHVAQLCDLENSMANAHLIAAAPELYEYLAWLDRRGCLGIEIHKEIVALLAKARGEV